MSTPATAYDPTAFRFEAAAPRFATPDPAATGAAPRRFVGVAYSGEVIPNHWAWGSLVIDLEALGLPDPCPCLLNHDRDAPVGVCALRVVDGALAAEGLLLRNERGQHLAQAADDGFPWQLSIHAEPGVIEEVQPGVMVSVNGHAFTGPLTVFRQTRVRELSFTPTGYDHRTSASVLSLPTRANAHIIIEDLSMPNPPLPDAPETGAQLAALTAQVTALTTRAADAEAALEAARATARTQAVTTLFADLGRPVPEKSLPHYLALSEAAFTALAADLRAFQPVLSAQLFSEQATGQPGPAAPTITTADIYAARRGA
ncbi:MAG: hypothetical protein WAT36_02255 [Chromatiaceae bacterium]